MKILALTYERGWEIGDKDHEVHYVDINSPASALALSYLDLVIEREFNDGKALYTNILKLFPTIPKAFWFIDAHVGGPERYEYCKSFDYIFVAHSPYIDKVKQAVGHDNVFWLPLCYPYRSDSITPNYQPIKYPISFVGRWIEDHPWFTKRVEMIKFLKDRYGDKFTAVTDYNNMMTITKQSKAAVNRSVMDDLNFRVFEVLGAGTELVTNWVPDIDRIDGLRQRCQDFAAIKNMGYYIDGILADQTNLTHNTLANQQWIKYNHTIKQRLEAMLRMIKSGEQEEF